MKSILIAAALFVGAAHAADKVPEPPPRFDLTGTTIAQVLGLYFKEVSRSPYVLCDAVLNDPRLVGLRAEGKVLDELLLGSLLDEYGFQARRDASGVVHVCKRPERAALATETFVYRPQFRDVAYLVDLAAPMVKGAFANRRVSAVAATVTPPAAGQAVAPGQPVQASPAMSMGTGADDMLVFSGEAAEVEKLRGLVAQLDVRPAQVMVRAYLYDVGKSSNEASALSVMLDVLKGRISAGIGSQLQGADFARLSFGGLDVVVSALSTDGRFKLVSSPSTLLRSGESARLQVGTDLQVATQIVTSNGQSSQGLEFKSSGVILEVKAKVHGQVTDVDLTQTVSDFQPSGSTVALNKREHRTALSVADGELVVIGGLNQATSNGSRQRLPFFGLPLGKSEGERSSELVLVLEVRKS